MTDQTVTTEVTPIETAPLATVAERTEMLDNATSITVDELTTETAVTDTPATEAPATVSQEDFNKLYFQLKQTEREKAALENGLPNTPAVTAPVTTATPELSLEQFDFDETAYNTAVINKAVTEQVAAALATQETTRQQATAEETQQNIHAQFNENAAAYATANPGYEKAIQAAGNSVQYPQHIQEAILGSAVGPQMDHALLSNPQLIQTLSTMSPMQALMEMGRMESQFKAPTAPTAPATVAVSTAPEPIENVGSGGGTHIAGDYRYEEDVSMESYYAQHQENLRAKNGG